MSEREPTVRTVVLLPDSLHSELRIRAAVDRRPMSALISEALRAYFDEQTTAPSEGDEAA